MYSNMNISSFEGAYRRQPNQNLQGASKTCNVSELINKIQIERRKREEVRIFTEKATVIQSHYRSYRTRKYWREVFRQQINEKILSIKNGSVVGNFGELYYLLFRAHYVYPRRGKIDFEDLQSFVFIMQSLHACLRNVIQSMNTDMFWFSYFIHTVKLNFEVIACISNKNITDKIALMNNLSSILNPRHIFESLPRDRYVIDMLWRRILRDDFLLDNSLFVSASFLVDDELPEEAGRFISDIFRCLIDVSNISPNTELRADIYRSIGSSFMKPPLTKGLSDFLVQHFNSTGGFPIAGVAREYWYRPDEEMTREALFRFLSLDSNQTAIPIVEQNNYFILLSKLLRQIYYLSIITKKEESDGEEDVAEVKDERLALLEEITALLNNETRSNIWIDYLNFIRRDNDNETFIIFCQCVYLVWLEHYSLIYTHRVLKELFLHSDFLRLMWMSIKAITYVDTAVTPPHLYPTYDMLAHGVIISSCEAEKIIPSLTMFCYFLKHQLAIINDAVLFNVGDPSANPSFFVFTVDELLEISRILKNVTIGIISLAFPTFSFNGCLRIENKAPTGDAHLNTLLWRTLLEQLFGVLRLLHSRDGRRRFTPANFWVTSEICDIRQPLNDIEAFKTLMPFSDETSQRTRNVYEDRHLTVLKHIPFLVDFMTRIRLLQSLIQDLKDQFQNPTLTYFHNVYVNVNIRRDYIYEDAFNELNIDAVNEIRIPIRVTFVNSVAGEEPGIDGGGVFREFMISFLKSAFDPNRGFFLINAQNEFYPNPNIESIHKDFKKHYSFMGRMLGKAIYEGILIEIPIAEFFLDKLFHSGDNGQCDLYLCGLASLDPDLYRNLMSLITYDGDFADLELDFTLSVDSFGANNIIELVENGSSIPVTSQNVVEYVHRVGKYKINDQIAEQSQAFIEGLTSVIPHHWISMFSTKELQLIISGNESSVDIIDLRRNCIYSEPYSDFHPTIEMFWQVMSSFDGNQRGRLLRFVTSSSRAPLLGFKDLFPPFCIQYVEDNTKLPTSSTCMNILKLPNFKDKETMRQKLLYAISANAGFELS